MARLPPLNPHMSIVDDQGRPTPAFIQWWEQQRQVNAQIPVEAQSLSDVMDLFISDRGSLLTRGPTSWIGLGPGTSGRVLKSAGPGADLVWGQAAFTELSDTPTTYTGQGSKGVRVNSGATALEFFVRNLASLSDWPDIGAADPGDVLTVSSDTVPVPVWATPSGGSGGAWTQIDRQVLGSDAASVTFSSIPGTYNHLKILATARGTTGAASVDVGIRFNGDTGANYRSDRENRFGATGASTSYGQAGQIPAATFTASYADLIDLTVTDYALTTFYKTYMSLNAIAQSASPYAYYQTSNGFWLNTAAVTSITLLPTAASFLTGSSFTLYGIT